MNFLKINGAHGEGGGQIVRSAITLSCIINQPIHLENIRKNRKNEGLKPQHLAAIKILKKISNAKVIGADTLGSTELKIYSKRNKKFRVNRGCKNSWKYFLNFTSSNTCSINFTKKTKFDNKRRY